MGQRTEYLDEEWEPAKRRKDGKIVRHGVRRTRVYRRFLSAKDIFHIALGIFAAALLQAFVRLM